MKRRTFGSSGLRYNYFENENRNFYTNAITIYFIVLFVNKFFFEENEKDLADIPEEVREDLTIHAVDRIDEVLNIVLEAKKTDELLETPQIWSPDSTTSGDISAVIE